MGMEPALMAWILVAIGVVGFFAYVRFSKTDPQKWHVDPEQARNPGASGVLLRTEHSCSPEEAMAEFAKVALSSPRSIPLAGSIDDLWATFETRTKILRFPDYVTVKAVASAEGAELVILSRLRFGKSDLGVNAVRIANWVGDMNV